MQTRHVAATAVPGAAQFDCATDSAAKRTQTRRDADIRFLPRAAMAGSTEPPHRPLRTRSNRPPGRPRKYPLRPFSFCAFIPPMSDAPTTAAPLSPPRPPRDRPDDHAAAAPPTLSTHLLTLVGKLFDYGRGVILVLRQPPQVTRDHVAQVARRFGTPNLRLIVARVMRGLELALALKQRLMDSASRLDTPRKPRLPPLPRLPSLPAERARVQSPVRHGTPQDDMRLLNRMPTAEEIAARVLRRPIGKVLADICIDLGITPDHPLWRDLRLAVDAMGGQFRRVMRIALRRLKDARREIARAAKQHIAAASPAEAGPELAHTVATATGPP
jgi:hypothetical protein